MHAPHTPAQDNFARRDRLLPVWQLGILYTAGFFGLYIANIYFEGQVTHPAFLLIIVGIIVMLTWFTVFFTHHNRDVMMDTEFQNTLFAGAATINSRFCLITKRDGTIVYYDPGFQKMFPGFLRMERRAIDLLLNVGGARDEEKLQIYAALNDSNYARMILSLKASDGSTNKIVMTIDPLPRPSGFFLIRGRDYIEHRENAPSTGARTNDSAHPSSLVADLLHHLPTGVYTATPDGMLQFINGTLEGWLGYAPGEILQRRLSVQDIVYQRDKKSTGRVELSHFSGEVSLQKKNGSLLQTHLSQEVQVDGAGKPIGCFALVTETSGHDVKKKPDHSTLTLEALVSCSPIPTACLSADGKIIEVNDAMLALTKIGREDLIGHPLADLLSESGKIEWTTRLSHTLQQEPTGDSLPVELQLPGDRKVTTALYAGLAQHENSRSPQVIVHLLDTTEQKNLEMRFVHSQKMQAVGQLAGGIAHDFNNLLTAMIGFCDLLLMRHPAGDASFADIMQIKQNANRAANLVRQLLAFSRRQTLQPKTLDFTDVLAELSNLIRRLIGENIELKVVHGRDLGMVRADQGQLEQVLINLCVNARDAMTSGGTLTIQTKNTTVDTKRPLPKNLVPPAEDDVIMPGDYVLVEVIDTGTGIPPENLEKIFEPFFSTKEVGSGTGLGLATVYGIIKQTGGYIYVSSAPGIGTCFSLFFPRHVASESDALKEIDVEERAGADLTGKGTILLVEDEAPVRIFAARALKNKGYTVLEAESGEQALEIVEQHGQEIEVIVSDVIMPGMNGPAMIEQVMPKYPDIKVIFISGYAEDVFQNYDMDNKEFNFLPKPFTLKQLAGKVKEVREGKA